MKRAESNNAHLVLPARQQSVSRNKMHVEAPRAESRRIRHHPKKTMVAWAWLLGHDCLCAIAHAVCRKACSGENFFLPNSSELVIATSADVTLMTSILVQRTIRSHNLTGFVFLFCVPLCRERCFSFLPSPYRVQPAAHRDQLRRWMIPSRSGAREAQSRS